MQIKSTLGHMALNYFAARAQAEDEVNEANRKVRLPDPIVRLKYKNNPECSPPGPPHPTPKPHPKRKSHNPNPSRRRRPDPRATNTIGEIIWQIRSVQSAA